MDWTKQVSKILGIPTTAIMKNYYGKVDDALKVNEEYLLTFYDYLRDELTFPFTATLNEQEISCICLASEVDVDLHRGIQLYYNDDGMEEKIPLTKIVVQADGPNADMIGLYQQWFTRQ